MAKPITNEKRADIVKHMQAGESKTDIAKWLFVCVRTNRDSCLEQIHTNRQL